jgi:hypothetical protein
MSLTNSINLNTSTLTDSEEQTITNIQNLQEIETGLYNTLESNLTNGMLTEEEQQNIINKINEVSTMRINLYNSLTSSYSFYQTNVATARNVLNNQITALEIANQQLNDMKNKMNRIVSKNQNKRRLIQINTYYGKQYDAYSSVMKYILLICIPILILSLLSSKDIIPGNIYTFLVIIILVIGFIVLIRKIWDIYLRDSMNFDEYQWPFKPSFVPGAGSTGSSTTTTTITTPCVGALCCSDTEMYDETLNQCIPIPATTSTSQVVATDAGTIFTAQSIGSSPYNICTTTT